MCKRVQNVIVENLLKLTVTDNSLSGKVRVRSAKMKMLQIGIALIFVGLAYFYFVFASAIAETKTQKISDDAALTACNDYGGGTECSFCGQRYCHVISCMYYPASSCTSTAISETKGQNKSAQFRALNELLHHHPPQARPLDQ
jgi:hypothetical protein